MTTKQFWRGDLRQPITTNIQGLLERWYEWKRCLSPGEPAIFENSRPGSGCFCQFVEQRPGDGIENDAGAHPSRDVLDASHEVFFVCDNDVIRAEGQQFASF